MPKKLSFSESEMNLETGDYFMNHNDNAIFLSDKPISITKVAPTIARRKKQVVEVLASKGPESLTQEDYKKLANEHKYLLEGGASPMKIFKWINKKLKLSEKNAEQPYSGSSLIIVPSITGDALTRFNSFISQVGILQGKPYTPFDRKGNTPDRYKPHQNLTEATRLLLFGKEKHFQ